MNLDFSEEQKMFRAAARDFLASECPKSKVRELEESEKGHDPELWRKVADLGWIGLIIPEQYGGSGSEFTSLVVLFEEIGRNIFPSPLFSTVVLGALLILQYGNEEQKQKFLPRIARGETIMSLALIESSASYEPSSIRVKAELQEGGYVINGIKLFVNDAGVADYLSVVARTAEKADPKEGITLFLVDAESPGIRIEVMPTIARDKQCEVSFSDVRVHPGDILGEEGRGWKIVDRILEQAAVLKCAESVGAMEAVVDMTTEYAKERVQYGKAIASFQVIQHYLANMTARTLTAKGMTYRASWMVQQGMPCTVEVSAAKAWANEAYKFVTERAVQIHGAIGMTRDHDIGLYYRRAKAADVIFGDTDLHHERVAQQLWPGIRP
ncbi:MAG TPA: acyl-CoA dehydrogenase [Dehalococcoidia bacterium]|nr:acyl-CoA dehydrogenase [Dehalococcoidia bacterium]